MSASGVSTTGIAGGPGLPPSCSPPPCGMIESEVAFQGRLKAAEEAGAVPPTRALAVPEWT
eukprot:820408-Alexandrium_andersonii.AAC.1